ncbi:hypothetical protein CMK10_05820 [Candidatus Poribacteria bacterium]|nr:hypothetical protein [Candidatus Poribacteria bacterium]
MAEAWRVEGIMPRKSLEECARRIITTRFQEMMSFKEGAIDGLDIEFVHDMRVSSRRLRAAMDNFAECFSKKKFRKYLKKIKNITSTMGAVRDLDVLISKFKKDAKSLTEDEQIGVKNLIIQLQQKREEARKPMLLMFSSLEKERFDKKFLKFFEV